MIILSGIFFVVGAYLAFKANRNLLSPVFIAVGVMLFNYTGGVIIFWAEGRILTPLFISMGVLSYGLGAIFLATCLRFKPTQELARFREQPFFSIFPDTRVFFISLIAVFFVAVSLIAYYFYSVGIPLFAEDLPAHLVTYPKGRGIFSRSFLAFLPIVAVIAYLFVKARSTLETKIFLGVVAITAMVVTAFIGTRGAPLLYLLPFLILYGLLSKKFSWFFLLASFFIFLVVSVSFQYRYYGWMDLPMQEALLLFGTRLTVSQVTGLDYIINELVPRAGFFMGEVAWNGFKGILAVLRILPEHPTPFWVILFEIMHGADPRGAFTMTTTPIGDFYIDFGVLGIVIGMFFLGIISQLLYIKTLRYPKDYLILPVMVYLHFTLVSIHIAGGPFIVFGQYGISLMVIVAAIVGLTVILSLPTGKVIVRLPKRYSRLTTERRAHL